MACYAGMSQQSRTVQLGEYVSRQVGEGVIDFSVGHPNPSLLPMEAISAAASHRYINNGMNNLILQYGPRQGYPSFRKSLAAFLSQHYTYEVDAEQLLITSGVSHGLDMVCKRLTKPGDVVLVERPTYFLAQGIFDQNHLVTVGVPTDEQGLDVDVLEEWLRTNTHTRPRLLYSIPVFNNPRGTVMGPARRQRLVELSRSYGFYVVADEVYQMLSFPECTGLPPPLRAYSLQTPAAVDTAAHSTAPSAAAHAATTGVAVQSPAPPDNAPLLPCDHVISVGSFSKIMAPGLRCGWIEASPPIIERLKGDAVLESGGCTAGTTCGVMHSVLELGLLQPQIDRSRAALSASCAAMVAALTHHLPQCRFVTPQGGYFVWLQLPEKVDARGLLALCQARHQVAFTPGPRCQGPACALRLCFAFYTPAEIELGVAQLAAGLAEVLREMEGNGGA